MAEFLTAAQMRAIERAAIASGDVTGLALMERAGRGVVRAVFEEWPALAKASQHAVVLCGPGNNGGDGFVVARLLHKMGWDVDVFLYGDPDKLPADAKANYERWSGPVEKLSEHSLVDLLAQVSAKQVLILDAHFGLGQRTPMDDALAAVNTYDDAHFSGTISSPSPLFVSVDLPTGYDADTGDQTGARPFPADLTVPFHTKKPIHAMPHFLDQRLHVVDIGL